MALERLTAPANMGTTNVNKNTAKQELDLARARLNQMAIAGISMEGPMCKRKGQIICIGTLHRGHWHSNQNIKLRSRAEAPVWLENEIAGNFIETVGKAWHDVGNDR
eukprot:414893-Pyramimonas_sp.AAC.1